MWRVRTHCGALAEPPDRRAWAAADRQGARPGTAAAMPAVPRKGAGRRVDQVEGDGLNPCQAIAIPPFRKVVLGLIDNGISASRKWSYARRRFRAQRERAIASREVQGRTE